MPINKQKSLDDVCTHRVMEIETDPPLFVRRCISLASSAMLLNRVTLKFSGVFSDFISLYLLHIPWLTRLADGEGILWFSQIYSFKWPTEERDIAKRPHKFLNNIATRLLWLATVWALLASRSSLQQPGLRRFLDQKYPWWLHLAFAWANARAKVSSSIMVKLAQRFRRLLWYKSALAGDVLTVFGCQAFDWIQKRRGNLAKLIKDLVLKGIFWNVSGSVIIFVLNRIVSPLFFSESPLRNIHFSWLANGIPSTLAVVSELRKSYWQEVDQANQPVTRLETMDRYHQDPILGQTTIRLLLIYPRHPHGPVRCALLQTPYHSAPQYEAISYCWGDPSRVCSIEVNGGRMDITANAFKVLKSRSSIWLPRLVWIDSICINQDDNEEKAQIYMRKRNLFQSC